MNVADLYATGKENWRIVMLAVFLIVSAAALAPGAETEGATNLDYGLELSGGTQVRAPLEGKTATGLDYSGVEDIGTLQANVSAELGVPETDVKARPDQGTFEVYSENVSDAAIAQALTEAGVDASAADVDEGLTDDTYDLAKRVIETKLAESTEFTGGRVTVQQTPTGEQFLKVEVPGATRQQVIDLLNERGLVEVEAVYPVQTDNGTVYRNDTLFTQAELRQVGAVREDQQGQPYVPITLTESATDDFTQDMVEYGFAQEGGVECAYENNPEAPGHCLIVYKDGEYINSFGMAPRLADSLRDGTFGGSFRMQTKTTAEARDVRVAMEAGALPTDIEIEDGDNLYISSQYADDVKLFSLITGIIAAISVALVVFVRYRRPRVAAPMVVTALAEVFILLGFASAIGLALDLSHIAGFIAVIGTGVDDLVIIADEVLNQGDVSTRRVFQNRFRKAFWVIGVAAITTIIAMLPLTVLSLGDLTGFALVTIVGVLIGVLVTRPAYGDILRALITSETSN